MKISGSLGFKLVWLFILAVVLVAGGQGVIYGQDGNLSKVTFYVA